MNKYIVEFSDDGKIFMNWIGDYTHANTPEDAVEYAKDYVIEHTDNPDELKDLDVRVYTVDENSNRSDLVLETEIKF